MVEEPATIPRFTDSKGRAWSLELTVGLVEQIKNDTGIDLDLIIKDAKKLALIIAEEPKKLAEVLWVCCEEQAKQKAVEPDEFIKAFNRRTLDDAADCLIEAIILFYPRGSAGRVLRERLPQLLREMDSVITKRAEKIADSTLSNMPTG